jgi:hypothetical protein
MGVRARILYEDSATQMPSPLHRLVCAWVDDRCGVPGQAQRFVEGMPRDGVSKLLASCQDDRFFAGGASVFALMDADKISRELRMPGTASSADVEKALAARCGRARPVLLDRNLETLIEAVADCTVIAPDQLEAARRKKINDRDLVILGAVRATPAVRRCVLGKVPSLDPLIAALCAIVCPPP